MEEEKRTMQVQILGMHQEPLRDLLTSFGFSPKITDDNLFEVKQFRASDSFLILRFEKTKHDDNLWFSWIHVGRFKGILGGDLNDLRPFSELLLENVVSIVDDFNYNYEVLHKVLNDRYLI